MTLLRHAPDDRHMKFGFRIAQSIRFLSNVGNFAMNFIIDFFI